MITINIKRNKKKEIVSFSLNGHAGYDVNGKDIVCAAVSAVTNMVLIGLNEVLKLKLKFEKSDGGYIKVILPEDITSEEMMSAQILLKSMVIEFLDIESNYKGYILVKES
jgi:uncharacterized protein YsxB (DUF464 family)